MLKRSHSLLMFSGHVLVLFTIWSRVILDITWIKHSSKPNQKLLEWTHDPLGVICISIILCQIACLTDFIWNYKKSFSSSCLHFQSLHISSWCCSVMFNKTHPSLSTCSRILATSINSSVVCLVQNSGLYPTCNEKIFVLTSPSLPASSNQNLPFLLLSSLHGNTLLEHLSLSPSLVWKDIAQWWRYVLGISSFLLSNRESVGLESAKKTSLH